MTPTPPERTGAVAVGELFLVVLIALVVRLVFLNHTPDVDEINHILAARSLLETGEPRIPGGALYSRAYFFTLLVAASTKLLGPGLEAARAPAVAAGVLLVAALFLWLRRVSGRPAAWTGALLLCFAPIAIYTSQASRFYSLHALLVWAAIAITYRLSDRGLSLRTRAMWTLLLAGCLILAMHLQILTLVPIMALALWTLAVAAERHRKVIRRHPALLLAIVATIVLAAVAVAVASGFVAKLLALADKVPPWSETNADNWRFYHRYLQQQYAVIWALFPAASVLALIYRPRAASLLLLTFAVALVLHSVAAWKEERYFFHAMPVLFAIVGLAVGASWSPLRDGLARAMERLRTSALREPGSGGTAPLRPGLRRLASVGLVLMGLFALTGNTAYGIARRMLTHDDADFYLAAGHLGETYRGKTDWAEAVPFLRPLVDSVDVVVGSSDLMTLYFTGRLEYELYQSHIETEGGGEEFSRSWKHRRPIVSEPSSVARIMACHESGLVLIEPHVLGWSGGVPRETAEFIAAHMREVDVPADPDLFAWTWRSDATAPAEDCPPSADGG